MLKGIVQFSLRFRTVVLGLAALLLVYGWHVAGRARLDVFPEFAPPMVILQTEAPGLTPEDVESLVTRPLEAHLQGVAGLAAIRSQSIHSLSVVTLTFTDATDIYRARQVVSERLTELAGILPQGVPPPKLGPLTSSTSLTLALGLTSAQCSPMALRAFAQYTLRPRLLSVPGVAKVDLFGGEVRQLQVQVSPERLRAYGLGLNEVTEAARQATGIRGAGFIENANQRVLVRVEGQALNALELGETIISRREGLPICLRDVAQVVDGAEPKVGDALVQGEPGVVLIVFSQYGANVMEVTGALEQALAEMAPLFKEEQVTLHPDLFRPANFIEASLKNLRASLWWGGLLIGLVLLLFLRDLRTACISFLAIPLSLLAAIVVLDLCGGSLNTITLGGLAIAIGVVVDDAIIDVENILRRVRERRQAGLNCAWPQVVLEASFEVRSAVVYATFVVALVFMPVFGLTGVQGRLFSPLALAFVLATLASLVTALTVTPALCLVLLPRSALREPPAFVHWLKAAQRGCLVTLSRRPIAVMLPMLVLAVGALAKLPFFGGEFLPEFQEGHFILHMAMVPGTSLPESLRMGRLVTAALRRHPHVRSVSQEAGRAENGEDTWGAHYSELHIDLAPLAGEQAERTVQELRAILAGFPGVSFRLMPFLTERIEETLSGANAQVVVNLLGDDLAALDQAATDVHRVLAEVPGAADVQTEVQAGNPEVRVRLRRERLREFGFRPGEVMAHLAAALQGETVAQTYAGNRLTEVVVILDPARRRDPESIAGLLLRNPAGQLTPLGALAEIGPGNGRSVIVHEGARRRQQVGCNVQGRDLASFLKEAKQRLTHQVRLPPGVYAAFAGSGETQRQAQAELLWNAALAALGVLLLLRMVLANWRHVGLVLLNLPFALVGGVVAIAITGGVLSLGSLVGFVTLFGISMRNSLMIVAHYQHLVEQEGCVWDLETAIRGASERLAPVLMTALVTGLGLLPLALGSGDPGREIEGPMATVILGGLLTSTGLNLLLLPIGAWRFARFTHLASATSAPG